MSTAVGATIPTVDALRASCGRKVSRKFGFAAGLLGMIAAVGTADARPRRQAVEVQPPAPVLQPVSPLTMIISLNSQRMWVYDAKGFLVQTQVSTGKPGYDTPTGIYSIIQKKEEHYSNLYDSAPMPYMQRLLQTGIAMHAGVVPGYAASHGCIRLPHAFAPKLFSMTNMNERVIVTPDAFAPVEIEHPNLIAALPRSQAQVANAEPGVTDGVAALVGVSAANATGVIRTVEMADADRLRERQALVDAVPAVREDSQRAAAARDLAVKASEDARAAVRAAEADWVAASKAAKKADRDAEQAERNLRQVRWKLERKANRLRADELEELRAQETFLVEEVKALAVAVKGANGQTADAVARIKDRKANVRAVDDARLAAKKNAVDAEAAIAVAEKAIEKFDRQTNNRPMPVSILISAKTGKISLRQGWESFASAPFTIDQPEVPLGNFLLTATSWRDGSQTDLNWTAVKVPESQSVAGVYDDYGARPQRNRNKAAEALPPVTSAAEVHAALARIQMPDAMRVKIAEVVKPGSTVIISDYDMAQSETRIGGTDFIVQLPEVVAKINAAPKQQRYAQDYGGDTWFFGSPPQPMKKSGKKYRAYAPSSPFWNGW